MDLKGISASIGFDERDRLFHGSHPGIPTCLPDRSSGGGGQCRPRWPESSLFLTGSHSFSGNPTS